MKKYILILFLMAVHASAQAETSEESGLDVLLATPISTAAKYEQRMSQVPASVTVITAEEIARYGWHTLADVLNGVRGVYTTYDRGYTYLGVRGIGLPTDYNTRFLVLIDGHPMLDSVSGAIDIGTALAIDLSSLEKIEFVRGPSSVMYGTGAMFGVINLVPKKEEESASLMFGAGNAGARVGSARVGFERGEWRGSVSASWQEKDGADFDNPAADFLEDSNDDFEVPPLPDYDDYKSVLATFGWRGLRIIGLQSTRTKAVTASLDDNNYGRDERFIDHKSRGLSQGRDEIFVDGRTLIGLRYEKMVRPGRQLTLFGYYDRFHYNGEFPLADGFISHDESESQRMSLEAHYIWDLKPNHRLTLGARRNRTSRATYRFGDDEFDEIFDMPFTADSLYAQSEWQPKRGVTITAGASYDRYSNDDRSHVTPRAAVILQPHERSTLKLLYGQGFRMANVFEQVVEAPDDTDLAPERIRTTELVWEYRMSPDLFVTTSLFNVDADDVIRFESFWGEIIGYFNASHVVSRGAELQVDYRNGDGIWSYVNYSAQRALENGEPMANSPEHLVKAGISTPTSGRMQGAVEVFWSGGRRTMNSGVTDDVLLTNLNVTRALNRHVSIALAVRNVFDTRYELPGGAGNTQGNITQYGRTFLIRFITRAR